MTKTELRENQTVGAILLNMLIAAVSLFVNGFGLYLTIRANIGAAPWDVLNLGISKTFGILYGTASIAVSVTILGISFACSCSALPASVSEITTTRSSFSLLVHC